MKRINFLLSFLALGFLVSCVASHVEAVDVPLRVAPARQEFQLDPGETSAVTIKFYNLSDVPVNGIIKAADFIVQDNEGTPTIVDSVVQASPKYSASSWITLPYDQMAIASQDKVTVQAILTVPQNARPGGRYVALYFEPIQDATQPQASSKAALVSERIAGLVYIRVNGPITEKALISRIYAPSFQEYGPIRVEADVVNQGDYHVRPQGSVSMKNMFGGFVDQQKLPSENIFPDTLRTFASTVGHKWMFGRYTVEFLAAYGTTGQVVKRSIAVWILPWKLLLALILTVLLITLLVKKLYVRFVYREKKLEAELEAEHDELEKLKQRLPRR